MPIGIHHHLKPDFSVVSVIALPGASFTASGAPLSTDDTTLEAALAPLLAALPATLAPLLAMLPATLAPLLAALPATLAALPATLAAEDPTLAAPEATSLAASLVSAQPTATAAAIATPPNAAAARFNGVFIVLFSPPLLDGCAYNRQVEDIANHWVRQKNSLTCIISGDT